MDTHDQQHRTDKSRAAESRPKSPCTGRCALAPDGRSCTGCFRLMEEIASWRSLGEAEQWSIVRALATRRR